MMTSLAPFCEHFPERPCCIVYSSLPPCQQCFCPVTPGTTAEEASTYSRCIFNRLICGKEKEPVWLLDFFHSFPSDVERPASTVGAGLNREMEAIGLLQWKNIIKARQCLPPGGELIPSSVTDLRCNPTVRLQRTSRQNSHPVEPAAQQKACMCLRS